MTKDKVIEDLRKCQLLNEEAGHYAADAILCDFLESLGYSDIVEEWNKVEKWYA